jgi:hypothetical protein
MLEQWLMATSNGKNTERSFVVRCSIPPHILLRDWVIAGCSRPTKANTICPYRAIKGMLEL